MGIRFKQDIGAIGGMAAYAAGLGQARQRQSKYTLDLLRDQQRLQAAGSKYRSRLGGGRVNRQDPFGQQAAGKWDDPFANAVAAAKAGGDPQEAVRIRSQRKANARAARLGLPAPHPGVDPVFIPAPTPAEKRAQQQHQWDLDAQKERWKFQQGETDLANRRKGIDARIPEIPGHLVNTPFGTDLKKLNDAEMELRNSRNFVPNHPDTQDKLNEIREKRQKILDSAPLGPDPNAGGLVYDEDSQGWQPAGEGQMAQYRRNPDGTMEITPEYKAKLEADKERIKEEKAAEDKRIEKKEAAIEKVEGRIQKLQDDVVREGDKNDPNPKHITRLEGMIKKEEDKLSAMQTATGEAAPGAAPAPGAPAAGGGAPVVPAAPAEYRFYPDTCDLIPAPAAPAAPGGPPPVPEAPALAPPDAIAPGAAGRRQPRMAEPAGAVAPPPDPRIEAKKRFDIITRNKKWLEENPPEPKRPSAPKTGPPLAQQPTGKAAEGMKKGGYEKVHVLDAEGNPTGKSSWKKKPPTVKNDAEWEALEPGTVFIDPFGQRRRKE